MVVRTGQIVKLQFTKNTMKKVINLIFPKDQAIFSIFQIVLLGRTIHIGMKYRRIQPIVVSVVRRCRMLKPRQYEMKDDGAKNMSKECIGS